ncbi:MAG: LysE family translocator [bacterium]|nr:LysE family translocator [bacterium]
MELKVWLIYLLTEFLLSITPGPAVMLISTQGFKYGAKPSYFGSLGISSGNLMYFILTSLGLGAIILSAGNLFMYIKIGGAIYLIGCGLLMIYKSFKSQPIVDNRIDLYQNNFKSFLQGFITQASNPKAIIFFVALLPQFIDQTKNVTIQFTILALTTIIMETIILMFYGWIAANGKKMIGQNNKISKWQDRFAGSILIGLGFNLIFIKMNIK